MADIESKKKLPASDTSVDKQSVDIPTVQSSEILLGQQASLKQIQMPNAVLVKSVGEVMNQAVITKQIQTQQLEGAQTQLNQDATIKQNLLLNANLENITQSNFRGPLMQEGLLNEVNRGSLYKKYFADILAPHITKTTQRKFAGMEEEEEQQEMRGDLFEMELKNHLAQLKTPSKKQSVDKTEIGVTKTRENISTLLHDKLVSMLKFFPWFYNFIKGVVVLRTTKQD